MAKRTTNPEMKIGIIIWSLPPYHIGGAERQIINLTKHLAKKHRVTVFTRRYFNAPKTEIKNGVVIRRTSFINIPILRYFSHIFFTLKEIRKQRREIDVLICYMFNPSSLIGVLAKKLYEIPTISAIRGEDQFKRIGTIKKYLINPFIFKNSDIILTQTERLKHGFISVLPKRLKSEKKVVVVPNGIDIPNVRASGNNIVYAGRLTRGKSNDKGVRYLIEAVRCLSVKTLIIGYGPEEEELKKQSKGLKVEFTGKIQPQDMTKYMKKGKIFVFPAVYGEGLPNVILEAMSVGLPVIATKTAGIPDIIEHGKTGFLVEPTDAEEIRKYINVLLKNEKLRSTMSKNCLKEIRKYSWDKVTTKLEKVLMGLA